jgi:outer membrane protein assembly factor BamA
MYFRQKKIVVGTVDNKQLFLFSPSFVYGQHVASASIKHRPGLYTWHTAIIQYETHRVNDTVSKMNDDFLPGRSNTSSFLRFEYDLQIDFRNSKFYPLKGWFFELDALYYHFLTGKEEELTVLKGSAAWYKPMGNRWFASVGLSGDYALEKDLPYLLAQSFGYYNFPRGYELYVVDGRGWTLFRSGVKYQLVSPHVGKMKFLKNERFSKFHYSLFLGAFYDGGYVYENQNNDNMTGAWLGGYGLGLDFVTYYDQVFRLEVSNNKFNQIGIFVHFSAPF